MAAYDTILNLVDRLIAEKEKNFMLQQQLQQAQQAQQEQQDKKRQM